MPCQGQENVVMLLEGVGLPRVPDGYEHRYLFGGRISWVCWAFSYGFSGSSSRVFCSPLLPVVLLLSWSLLLHGGHGGGAADRENPDDVGRPVVLVADGDLHELRAAVHALVGVGLSHPQGGRQRAFERHGVHDIWARRSGRYYALLAVDLTALHVVGDLFGGSGSLILLIGSGDSAFKRAVAPGQVLRSLGIDAKA